MSEVYVNEPPLHGKVFLQTTMGPLEIGLWSREAPKACRNFVQLCLEGYYDGTIFHRVIPGFIIQGGDPTGTGDGGESIYGEGFANEYHSRLKFRYRGMLGMANLGRAGKTNNSQFFFTLGPCTALNNRNTLFGKIVGETTYNLVKLGEVPVDEETPLDPPRIISTQVVLNPFPDIVPRVVQKSTNIATNNEEKPKRPGLACRTNNLLSFGDQEEDEDASVEIKPRVSKSAHDLLSDPKLLDSAASEEATGPLGNTENELARIKTRLSSGSSRVVGLMAKTTKLNPDEAKAVELDVRSYNKPKVHAPPCSRDDQIKKLKSEISSLKMKKIQNESEAKDGLLTETEKRREVYLKKKNDKSGQKRQAEVVSNLNAFTGRVKKMRSEAPPLNVEEEERATILPNLDEEIDESDGSWLTGGGLKFSVDSAKAYQLDEARTQLEVDDPLLRRKDAKEFMRKTRLARQKPLA